MPALLLLGPPPSAAVPTLLTTASLLLTLVVAPCQTGASTLSVHAEFLGKDTDILFLKILGGIAALILGLYLGGGTFSQSRQEIDHRMGTGGRTRKVKQHFMWLNYLRPTKRGSERRAGRSHFRTAVSTKPADPKRPPSDGE